MNWMIYGMIYLGSALMVYNIYSYVQYARHLQEKKDWGQERRVLYIPIILLVLFLLGYLAVGIFGHPDLIISGILFGGSIFVFIIFRLLQFITYRVQKNEHLEAELLAAEESNKTKTAILSSVSHEMRTPMNAIIGLDFIALKNPKLHLETRRQLEKIDENARHLMALIENILDMSDIDAGKLILKHDTFSLYELLDMINHMLTSQCTVKGLEYRFAVNSNLEDYYVGDQRKLRQVLVSVLDNAVKYTDSPGTVSFSAMQLGSAGDKRRLRFIVNDTGVGMEKNFIPKIFDSFTQEDVTMTDRFGGIGLSLAVTKSIVELMDGKIEVSSKKDVGSTFTITLSLGASDRTAVPQEEPEGVVAEESTAVKAEEPQEQVAAEELTDESQPVETESDSVYSIQGKRVLIAEDIDINAEILADLLDMEEVSSERAENGEIAVQMFSDHPENYYDAILMDLRMPVMDGLEAARRIRALDRPDAAEIPIIALTANASNEDKQNVLDAGMNCHHSKPVDPDVLYGTLEKLTVK